MTRLQWLVYVGYGNKADFDQAQEDVRFQG
jgi:hypothetical protein